MGRGAVSCVSGSAVRARDTRVPGAPGGLFPGSGSLREFSVEVDTQVCGHLLGVFRIHVGEKPDEAGTVLLEQGVILHVPCVPAPGRSAQPHQKCLRAARAGNRRAEGVSR